MQGFMKYSNDPLVGQPAIGVLLLGCLYLMYRGLWGHAILFILLFIPTFGLIYIWYIFKARQYITKKLYMEGYFDDQRSR